MYNNRRIPRTFGVLMAAAVLGLGATAAQADKDLIPGYVVGASGKIVRNGHNNCLRDGSWKPELVVKECDPDLWAQMNPQPAPAPMPAAAPARGSFAITETIDAKTLFDFNAATLTPAATQTLTSLGERLARFESIKRVAVTGYTDRLGSDVYNQRLSDRRAAAVANFLRNVSRLPGDKIHERGMGEANPVSSCGNMPRRQLVECLAPDRRVEIAITADRVNVSPGTR